VPEHPLEPYAEQTSSPRRILYFVDSYWACAWYRCYVPGVALRRRGHDVRMVDSFDQTDVEWCDVFVVQRPFRQEVLQAVRHANALGKTTVFEIDDDLWTLHPTNPAARVWSAPGVLDTLVGIMRECDVVTTTSDHLAAKVRRFNPNVRILANMLPDEHWPAQRKPVSPGPELVVGWGGGTSHHPDLMLVRDVLVQMLDASPGLTVQLAGADPSWLPPHPRVGYPETVIIEQYAGTLGRFDIAIAPLVDNQFNLAKSDLKVLEYAIVGLPVIASKVLPYVGSVRPGETGFLASSAKDWLKYLRTLVNDAPMREAMGAEARAWAETRLISRNIWRWEKTYGIAE
jgi:hypothetical protein